MRGRRWGFWFVALGALVAILWGCGDDKSTNPGGGGGDGTAEGQYEVYAGFVDQVTVTPDKEEANNMVFVATVERLTATDPSAKDAIVKVGETVIPLKATGSTDDEAVFESSAITYSADSTYAVTITIGGKTASASLGTPDYETTVAITAPLGGTTFTPGSPLTITWAYTGETPGKAVLYVMGDDEELTNVALTGATTTYTFPGTATSTWSSNENVMIMVGIGETQAWSGDMAYQGSFSYVLIDVASVTIAPEGGAAEWTITVTPTNAAVIVGQNTTVTASVTAGNGSPAPAGTAVSFTITPAGSGTVSPASATTNVSGIAQTTFTAGSSPTTATVTATALGYSGSAAIEVEPEGASGKYGLIGLILVDDDTGLGSIASTNVYRLNTADPGANTFTATLNQSDLTFLWGDANSAMFYNSITYTPGTTYTWTATGTAGTATAVITAPTWSSSVDITAPASNSEFTVGPPVVVSWAYTGDTPDSVEVVIASDDFVPGGTDHFFYHKLPGATTSYSFATDSWGSYDTLMVSVTLSKQTQWSGSIVEQDSSMASLVISSDAQFLFGEGYGPGPGGGDWYVYFDIDQFYLAQGSTSNALVEVEDENENPCADGTQVTFTVDPPGAATVSPNPATTSSGSAAVTVTAVAASGDVEITATALGDDNSAWIQIGEAPVNIWAIQPVPNPADLPLSALPVGGSVRVDLSIEDMITSEAYPSDVHLVLSAAFGGIVNITPTDVTVPAGGTATVTVTGVTVTTLVPEIVTITAPDVGEGIIPPGGFMVTVVD